ncbi:MAG: glycosyltransferase family 4 protein [Deltaproteobacteria bacterium]|nr:glycosyltransferase family 4 protein [Deltaproteobacteria bacterium]
MDIAYYMPFKPMGHQNPSGDLVTGTELFDHLAEQNHTIKLASRLRCRWIYYRPGIWFQYFWEKRRIIKRCRTQRPDLWISYHSYYKAPDILGSSCSKTLKIPYVIFQGIYSTKRKKKLTTLPGFLLNRKVLLSADLVITNKKKDLKNLRRILPEERVVYIAPGINPDNFIFSAESREQLRQKWNSPDEMIILTAAMFRPGVKTEGIKQVISSCAQLASTGRDFCLWICGDGACRKELRKTADKLLPGKVRFLGKIPRNEMYRYYSAADIFAFPGIEESLGLVYLEAQSCRLPVVACSDWGGGEAVIHNRTGLLSPATEPSAFTRDIDNLLSDKTLRNNLGKNGAEQIRRRHDLKQNYIFLEKKLQTLITPSSTIRPHRQ